MMIFSGELEQKQVLPQFHPFSIPKGATVMSMQKNIPIPYRYREILEERDSKHPGYWEKPSTSNSKQGGFIPLGAIQHVTTRDAFSCVEELAKQHNRSFYCGSVLDAFCYVSQKCPDPKAFVAFGSDCTSVLQWVTHANGGMFLLMSSGCTWRDDSIFVVEDL